jgi:hypothetical protein
MKPWKTISFWVSVLLAVIVAGFVVGSMGLRGEARPFPLGAATLTLVALLLVLAAEFLPRVGRLFEVELEGAELEQNIGAEPASGEPLYTEENQEDRREDQPAPAASYAGPAPEQVGLRDIPWRAVGVVFGSLTLFTIGVLLVGFAIATPLFVLLFLRLYGGATWVGSAALAGAITAAILGLSLLLRADLYPGVLLGANIPPF